jgi:cysteine desulfurase / selenocysteine lyase
MFDLDAIRADFPILTRRVHNKPLVYLDSAASAQKPRCVLDAMRHTAEHSYANVHRGLYTLASETTEAFEKARETVRGFLNAPDVKNIVFTRSATEAINLVAHSFGLAHLQVGDAVLVSLMEHHSNLVPWHFHRERKGVELHWWPVLPDGTLDLEALPSLLTPRTKLLAITHMSNVLGTINPIAEIVKIAHAHGVAVLVDGSQAAAHLKVDVQALGADFYVFTGHKTYGPTGIGVLYGKSPWLEKLPPYLGGGEMIETVTQDTVTYAEPPHRFEAGTPPILEAIGLGAALTYMQNIGLEAITAHEAQLRDLAFSMLRSTSGLTVYGEAAERGAVFSFKMDGIHPHDAASLLDHEGIAIRAGSHCAMPLMQHFGVTATCRASFGVYNTEGDIEALERSLRKVQRFFL